MATSDHSMENESLAVSIETGGTLALTDKRSGQTYRRLLTVEDRADIGDGWFHGIAVNDEAWTSAACPAGVALVHDGPMLDLASASAREWRFPPSSISAHGAVRSHAGNGDR